MGEGGEEEGGEERADGAETCGGVIQSPRQGQSSGAADRNPNSFPSLRRPCRDMKSTNKK